MKPRWYVEWIGQNTMGFSCSQIGELNHYVHPLDKSQGGKQVGVRGTSKVTSFASPSRHLSQMPVRLVTRLVLLDMVNIYPSKCSAASRAHTW
jgi:hypothetical protein